MLKNNLSTLVSSAHAGRYNNSDLLSIVASLIDKEGVSVTTDPNRWNFDTPGYADIYKKWQDAKFNPNAIKWTNYYPGNHYSQDIVDNVAAHLKLKGVHRSWISRIDPGYYAPWHWDVDDNEPEYLKKGQVLRYSISLSAPVMGHIFILGEDYLYKMTPGTIFKWKNYKEWHAGINAGMEPKFMFHIIGY